MEEAWYLQKYITKLLDSAQEGTKEEYHNGFLKYLKIYNVSRIIKYALYVWIAVWIISMVSEESTADRVNENAAEENGNQSVENEAGKSRGDDETENDKNSETPASTRFYIGDTATFAMENGGVMDVTLTGCGTMYDAIEGEILYVNYTIENVGDENLYVGDSLFHVYVDNYNVSRTIGDNSVMSAEISDGRKVDGTIYAPCSLNENSVIEVECADAVFVISDADIG